MQLVEHAANIDRTVAHISLLEYEERSRHGGPPVAVLRWPEQRDDVSELRCLGLPRLLLVGPDADPVSPSDDLEDWLRLPADDRDVRTRLLRLRDRAHLQPARPELDGYGRLLYADRWVALSGVEERLARPLVDAFGHVVRYDDLIEAAWPGQAKDKVILRPRITGLRRRVETIGLELRSIRDVGHVLHAPGAVAPTNALR